MFSLKSRRWFVLYLVVYPILCWCRCPEIGTSSIEWAQLSRFLPRDGDSPVSEMLFLNKYRTVDNDKKNPCNCKKRVGFQRSQIIQC
jgi:hypothetical protein